MEYSVGDVKKAVLNGRQVKLFEVWKLVGNTRIFFGQFSAPVKTSNKNLLAHIAEQLN